MNRDTNHLNTVNPFISSRTSGMILAIAWISMQAFLFFRFGIESEFEARKYIEQADLLLTTGSVSHPSMWLYSIQIFLIAAAKQLNTGFISVVAVQLLFNALATWSLYRLFIRLSNPMTAFICVLLFILNFPFQLFNVFLFTESLFYSFTILLSCYLLQLTSLTRQNVIVILLFLLLICFTRPSGLLWLPCVFLYLFLRFFRSIPILLKGLLILSVTIIFAILLNKAVGSGGELDFILPFREEHIICGVPTYTGSNGSTEDANSLQGIMNYIIQHPRQFGRLAWLRTQAFAGMVRPYFSSGHNIYLVLYFFPLYILLIASLRNWWRTNRPILIYCLALITVTWGTVILTCDDWHNRFFLSIVPYIYILTLPALQKIISKAGTYFSKK